MNFLPTLTKIRLCLLPLAVFLAVTIFALSATFAYDRHNQVKLTYDSSRESAFLGYDVGSMLARGDMENGIAGDRVRFFKFGELLAAKATPSLVNLNRQLAAQEIAGGHAFTKHAAEFGFKNQAQMATHIENVMTNPTMMRSLSNGRSAFWDSATGSVVIRNPSAIDGGTSFIPKNGVDFFLNLK